MEAITIINAAPMVTLLGTDDNSTRQQLRVPEQVPQHLPLCYLYTQKGIPGRHLVGGADRSRIFGDDSFDVNKKWYNHATVFSDGFVAEGNFQMIERVIPADAGPTANFRLSADLLETTVDDYDRNTDGSIKYLAGSPVVLGQIPGYKLQWVISTIDDNVDFIDDFGNGAITAGSQADVGLSTTSQLIPVLEFAATSQGDWGNNAGVRIFTQNTQSGGLDATLLTNLKAFPARFQIVRRANSTATPTVVTTVTGAESVNVVLKPNSVNPNTSAQMSIGDVLLDSYQDLASDGLVKYFGDFGKVAIYNDNIKTILETLYAAEYDYVTDVGAPVYVQTDFGTYANVGAATDAEAYLYNLFTGTTSGGYKYHTLAYEGALTLGKNTTLWAQSGSDGTMSDSAFATAVGASMEAYNDPLSSMLNTAKNVESVMYDSGFPLETKYDLMNFVALRRDTRLVVCTHTHGLPELTADEENSVAVSLRTRAESFPESEIFGTPAMRILIMGRSGDLISSPYKKKVPFSYEVARISAKWWGAGDGKWKEGAAFDGENGSVVRYMRNANVSFTPTSVRNKDWDAGLNYVQDFDTRSLFIPALKGVYNDDTSILTSWPTVNAIGETNKVLDRVWRSFSGNAQLSNAQLRERVTQRTNDALLARFNDRFVFKVDTYFTDADIQSGYRWTTRVDIYGPNMKTHMTGFVRAFRLDDLAA